MFHAFQDAFSEQGDCAGQHGYRWFDEGSATWAASWLFPHGEGDHGVFDNLLVAPTCASLNSWSYHSFPWSLDLVQHYGASVMPAIYAAFGGHDSLHALDAAIPGGLAKAWKQFTLDGWNQDGDQKPFVQWYGLNTTPGAEGCIVRSFFGTRFSPRDLRPTPLDLEGHHGYRFFQDTAGAGGLMRKYDVFSVPDGVKEITVHNHTVGNNRSDLQLIYQLVDGSWKTRDVSNTRETSFCTSNDDEKIQTLVLAYDDHSLDNHEDAYHESDGSLAQFTGVKASWADGITIDARDSCAHYFNTTAATGSFDYTTSYGTNRYQGDDCQIQGSESWQLSYDPSQRTENTDGLIDASGFGILIVPLFSSGGSASYHSSPCDWTGQGPCTDTLDDGGSAALITTNASSSGDLDAQLAPFAREDFFCAGRFADGWFNGDDKFLDASIPASALTSGKPFSVSFDHTASDDHHSVTRKLDVTFQPVSDTGKPLDQVDNNFIEGPLP
jgi:hypothetical protein